MGNLANHQGLLYAAEISSEGMKVDVDLNDPKAHLKKKNLLWLHMCALHKDTREFFENHSNLDDLVINAMLAEDTRPRILVRKEGVLIILRAVNLHEGCDPEDMISLRVWIGDNRIITTRMRDIKSIDDVKGYIEAGKGPRNAGEFLTMITDRVFSRMDPYIEDLEDRTGRVEEQIAHRKVNEICEDSGLVRIRTAIFSRYITPQATVLKQLIEGKFSWLSEENIEHLIESHDRVTRYVETLSGLRDRALIINDEINKIQDAKLNSTTYIFSLAATIFLPLSFLTGLLGINIGGMPGVNSNMAFWVFTGLCAIVAVLQILVLKEKVVLKEVCNFTLC